MFRKYFAEFFGTFILVFCGTGAMTINEVTGGAVTHVGIGLTWGFIVIALIYALGDVSGAHFNPAVTVGFVVAKKFPLNQMLPYVLFQLIGGVVASLLLYYLFPTSEWLGGTQPAAIISPFKGFIIELILTFILMFVIIHVSTGSKEVGMLAGIAIGGTVMLEALFAGPITNASMNPVRSIAPALVSGHLENQWLYLVAPIIGAALAVLTCRYIKSNDCCDQC